MRCAWRSILVCVLASAVTLAFVSSSSAQHKPPRADDPILSPDKYAAMLSDESFAARQSATAALLNIDTLTAEQVVKLIPDAKTPEARQRLHRVARHHLVRKYIEEHYREPAGTSGCLGVSMVSLSPSQERQGPGERPSVGVGQVFPGFPAAGRLEYGDRIIAVDGKALPSGTPEAVRAAFVTMVTSNQPGATVQLTVVRDGKEREVRVKLASMQALRDIYANGTPMITVPELADSYRLLDRRLADAAGAPAPPLKVDLTALPPPGSEARKSAVVPPQPVEPKGQHPDDDGADE